MAFLELELHAELLAHGGGDVGVDTGRLAGVVLELDGRVRDVGTDPDHALVPDRLGQLVGQRGGARRRAVAASGAVVLGLVTAGGEQQGASDREGSDRCQAGARGGRASGGACGHGGFLRRMDGDADGSTNADGSTRTHTFGCRDLV
ncbi:hypothetical protein QF030_005579 [Streptomyces rishiriensis]|uniref:Uncharacterized protein n=1 Tax=Streptomyces rishiriensis TaxID=68264 RepID=A0ABU0NW71_STRRH|nr:hypothetical protein [Streptomyces rishiriensis]